MNTERLNKIINEIQTEFNEINLVKKIASLRNLLKNVVNEPQQPVHQQKLVNIRSDLYKSLTDASSNEFGPIWKQVVSEIGGSELLGNTLKNRIELIFSKNQITPSAALEDLIIILKEVQAFNNAINQSVQGFNGLGIGKEDLEENECEVSYLIPRLYTEENLETLKKEVSELNFILNHISEVATGKKEIFRVKSISSSDYLFYINVSLFVGHILVIATEKILNTYKSILEIKKLRNELKEKGVPEKETKGIEDYANKTMETEIVKLAKGMVKEHYKNNDSARKNELINGLTISFNKIANRIDNGFNIDIRVNTIPERNKDEEIDNETKIDEEMRKRIYQASKSLEFINTSGKPILSLKENDKEDSEVKNSDTKSKKN